MIRFENVSYAYPSKTSGLREITLAVEKGDFLFIAGSTAEYKTTFLNLIYGRVMPATGTISVMDFSLPADKDRISLMRRHVGYVFHDFHFFDNLTVRENLLIPLCIKNPGKSAPDAEETIAQTLARYPGLRAEATVSSLSSGEKQMLNLIRAFITDPLVLLADDPFRLFQRAFTDRFMEILNDQHTRGMTVVVSTTSPAVPIHYKKRYCMLKGGRLHHVDA